MTVKQPAPTLNIPQAEFLDMPHKFKAFVAGFGSGKTWVGCAGINKHFWEKPKIKAGYFAPTYKQIRDIFFPTVEECAYNWGLRVEVREGNQEAHFYRGKRYRGTVICRSMDNPESIIGFKIGHALIDELDVMAIKKAEVAWRKVMARMRYKVAGLRNGIDVTTTPEGFKFVHNQFVKQIREKPHLAASYGLLHASTYDNEENLPDDYIQSLLDTYPEQLISAYLEGKFVNLTSGTVYVSYDKVLNASAETVQPGEPLFIGMDFNVGKMAAVTHVKRLGLPHAVDEFINAYDTPDIIKKIKERYWLWDGNKYHKTCEITIFPDASGGSRKSNNASTTDIQLLTEAGFHVSAPEANPPVKDRINSMNAMFCNADGARRYRVNADKCPVYSECLEQQVWNNGEPDKKQGKDHPNDAGGYFIHRIYPVVKPVIGKFEGMSML